MTKEWIRISERLPENDVGVLVTDGKIVTAAALSYWKDAPHWWGGHGFSGHEWNFDFSERFDRGAITHWMPLPPVPAEGE